MNSTLQYFVKNFYTYVHDGYWSTIFFSCNVFVRFWYQGSVVIKKSWEIVPLLPPE